jgi:hypothetical protein
MLKLKRQMHAALTLVADAEAGAAAALKLPLMLKLKRRMHAALTLVADAEAGTAAALKLPLKLKLCADAEAEAADARSADACR